MQEKYPPLCSCHGGFHGDVYFNYLCTYDLYSPLRNAFDAGSIHYEGK
jgi:hypothetical protein